MSYKEFVRSVLTSVTARNSSLTKLMSPRIVVFPLGGLCLLEHDPPLTIPPSVACSRGLTGPSGVVRGREGAGARGLTGSLVVVRNGAQGACSRGLTRLYVSLRLSRTVLVSLNRADCTYL
jgi:hypothetical protein